MVIQACTNNSQHCMCSQDNRYLRTTAEKSDLYTLRLPWVQLDGNQNSENDLQLPLCKPTHFAAVMEVSLLQVI